MIEGDLKVEKEMSINSSFLLLRRRRFLSLLRIIDTFDRDGAFWMAKLARSPVADIYGIITHLMGTIWLHRERVYKSSITANKGMVITRT